MIRSQNTKAGELLRKSLSSWAQGAGNGSRQTRRIKRLRIHSTPDITARLRLSPGLLAGGVRISTGLSSCCD